MKNSINEKKRSTVDETAVGGKLAMVTLDQTATMELAGRVCDMIMERLMPFAVFCARLAAADTHRTSSRPEAVFAGIDRETKIALEMYQSFVNQ